MPINDTLCDECGKGFTQQEWDNRHTHHEPDCPNENEWDDGVHHVDCECDINYHEKCCPVCAAEECAWSFTQKGDQYTTSCGLAYPFKFYPATTRFRFCPYCGQFIRWEETQ